MKKDKLLEGVMGVTKQPDDNSIDMNCYISKIRFNFSRRVLIVYGKKGELLWGCTEGANHIGEFVRKQFRNGENADNSS